MNIAQIKQHRQPRTLQDVVDQIKRIELECQEAGRQVYRLSIETICNRVRQGQLVDLALSINNGESSYDRKEVYGRKLIDALAEKAGAHPQTLYDAHVVYRRAGSMEGFRDQLSRWEDANVAPSWSMVRNWGRKKLPDSKEKAEEEVEKSLGRFEQRTRRLAQDFAEFAEHVSEWTPEKREEAAGVAVAVLETAETIQLSIGGVSLPKPTTKRNENFLAFLRQRPCCNCGSAPPLRSPSPFDRRRRDQGVRLSRGADVPHMSQRVSRCRIGFLEWI